MRHIPIKTPIIMESLRRLDLIIDTKLLIPGIVPADKRIQKITHTQKRLVRTYYLHHSRVDTSQRSPLS